MDNRTSNPYHGISWLMLVLAIMLVAYFSYIKKFPPQQSGTSPTTISNSAGPVDSGPSTSNPAVSTPAGVTLRYAYPVADFIARITKKPFGIYVSPQNSPVQPERFIGYHTGTDAEYQDVVADVPVYAIASGKIVLSRTASGYGGVFLLEFEMDGLKHVAVYGHIRPSSLPALGAEVTKGQQIALLGTGYSTETDGERRHLHFAILNNDSLTLTGYVQSKDQLSAWVDPVTIF